MGREKEEEKPKVPLPEGAGLIPSSCKQNLSPYWSSSQNLTEPHRTSPPPEPLVVVGHRGAVGKWREGRTGGRSGRNRLCEPQWLHSGRQDKVRRKASWRGARAGSLACS
jgi:hypothetical protein